MLSPVLIAVIIGGAVLLIGVGIALELRGASKTPDGKPSGGGFNPNFIILLVMIFGAVMLIVYTQLTKANLKAQYGSTIANMCETTVFANFDRNNLTSTHQPPRILILSDSGRRHSWHSQLPDNMRAEDQASTDIVACVMSSTHEQVVETCEYQEFGTGTVFDVSRVQYYRNVYLVDAATGRAIAPIVAWGAGPDYCPDTITTADKTLRGGQPQFNYFYDALNEFLGEYY
jgi:hypothetical protein